MKILYFLDNDDNDLNLEGFGLRVVVRFMILYNKKNLVFFTFNIGTKKFCTSVHNT